MGRVRTLSVSLCIDSREELQPSLTLVGTERGISRRDCPQLKQLAHEAPPSHPKQATMNSITINAKQITVTFGAVDVLKNVDLELHPAEIHAIIGENGAGKSSLAKVIAGEYRPREGTIELNNKQVNFKDSKEALRHRIALIHQEPITFQDLDITENIFAGHHPRKLGFINWKAAQQQAQEILNKLGTSLNPHARVAGLSVAQQQMVELA